jgi:hypothetical protein
MEKSSLLISIRSDAIRCRQIRSGMADCQEVNAGMLRSQNFAKPQAQFLVAALAFMVLTVSGSRASPLFGYGNRHYG